MAAPTTTTVTLNKRPDLSRRLKRFEVAVQLTDAGTPTYATSGLTVDLTTMTNPGGYERGNWAAGDLPTSDDIEPMIIPGGYTVYLNKNAASPTLKNYLLQIFTSGGSELGNGSNIPALLFGATVGASPKIIFNVRMKNFR